MVLRNGAEYLHPGEVAAVAVLGSDERLPFEQTRRECRIPAPRETLADEALAFRVCDAAAEVSAPRRLHQSIGFGFPLSIAPLSVIRPFAGLAKGENAPLSRRPVNPLGSTQETAALAAALRFCNLNLLPS